MTELAIILAAGSDELVYIIAVLVIIGLGWVVEQIKAKIANLNRRDSAPPRPRNRPHPTSLPRPQIPPFAADEDERRSRPSAPPAIPRARPTVPSSPAQRGAGPQQTRPGMPARPAARQRPQAGRTVEERRAVIRGETAPTPARPSPQPPPPPPAAQEQETWARLTTGFEQVRSSEKMPERLTGLLEHVAATGPVAVSAQSLRELSPAELRQAFVLKEILEPPLAMRDM